MDKIIVKSIETQNEYESCLWIRKEVFIREQGVPASIEIDSYESSSQHFLVFLNDKPIATGRLRIKDSLIKFERIATLKDFRGKGFGQKLMIFMLKKAQTEHPQHLPAMHAQMSAIKFYEKLGWSVVGDIFYEASIPHKLLIHRPLSVEVPKLLIWDDKENYPEIKKVLKI